MWAKDWNKEKSREWKASTALVISRVSEDGLGWDIVQMKANTFHLRAAYGFFCLSSFFFFFETWWHLKRQSASYNFNVPMYLSKLLSIQIPQVWYKALHCNKGGYWAGPVWNAPRLFQILHFPAKCYLEGVWEIAHPCGGEWRRVIFIMRVPYKVSTADWEAGTREVAWSHMAVKLSLVVPGSECHQH